MTWQQRVVEWVLGPATVASVDVTAAVGMWDQIVGAAVLCSLGVKAIFT